MLSISGDKIDFLLNAGSPCAASNGFKPETDCSYNTRIARRCFFGHLLHQWHKKKTSFPIDLAQEWNAVLFTYCCKSTACGSNSCKRRSPYRLVNSSFVPHFSDLPPAEQGTFWWLSAKVLISQLWVVFHRQCHRDQMLRSAGTMMLVSAVCAQPRWGFSAAPAPLWEEQGHGKWTLEYTSMTLQMEKWKSRQSS